MRQTDVLKLPDGTHSACDGLYLQVKGNARSWVVRMKISGKTFKRGLGSAREITLAQARVKAEAEKTYIRDGTSTPNRGREKEVTAPTFGDIYLKAIEVKQDLARWKNAKHIYQWTATVEQYALPILRDIPVADISRDHILAILRPIWSTKSETAYRLRGRLETILDWCARQNLRPRDNPARWRGNLEFDLPAISKVRKVEHLAAPTLEELRKIAPRLSQNVGGIATLFVILTASRVGEAVVATWDEIDFATKTWSVPPERRKDGKPYPHRVPLSRQAIELLKKLPTTEGYIFPGQGLGAKHINRMTPRILLKKSIGRAVTAHGCRSTFSDWCAENGKSEVLREKSLMHATGNEVSQAYQRSDLLEQRRGLMQEWADALLPKIRITK